VTGLLELLANDAAVLAIGALGSRLWPRRQEKAAPARRKRVRCSGENERGNRCQNFNAPGCETNQCLEHCRCRCRCGIGDYEP
jgi:hypothetical protein